MLVTYQGLEKKKRKEHRLSGGETYVNNKSNNDLSIQG